MRSRPLDGLVRGMESLLVQARRRFNGEYEFVEYDAILLDDEFIALKSEDSDEWGIAERSRLEGFFIGRRDALRWAENDARETLNNIVKQKEALENDDAS